jgi:hypothetical protein
MEIVAAWDPGEKEDGAVHRQWISDLSSVIAPLALPGGYPNFLTPDDREQGNAVLLRSNGRRIEADVFSSYVRDLYLSSSRGKPSFSLHFIMHASNYLHD